MSVRRHRFPQTLALTLFRIQQGKAYHCFCSGQRLAETRKVMQKKGSNATYDRRCLGLSAEEVKRRIEAGEQSVVRFKVSSGRYLHLPGS